MSRDTCRAPAPLLPASRGRLRKRPIPVAGIGLLGGKVTGRLAQSLATRSTRFARKPPICNPFKGRMANAGRSRLPLGFCLYPHPVWPVGVCLRTLALLLIAVDAP